MRRMLFASFATVLLSACMTAPQGPRQPASFTSEAVSQLVPGVTTEEQTRQLFGEPQRISFVNGGETVFGYSHIADRAQGSTPDKRIEALALRFGRDGKLITFSENTTVNGK